MSSEAGKSDGKVQKLVDILLGRSGEPDQADQPLLGKHLKAIIDPHGPKAKELLDQLGDEPPDETPPTT